MPIVKGNFDETPDQILPVGAGRHELFIAEPPEHTTSRKGNPMIVISYRVQTEGPDKSRTLREYVVNAEDPEKGKNSRIKLKRIAMAAGLAWSKEGIDTDALIGKTLFADVITETEDVKDDDGNVIDKIQRARIRDYVVAKTE